MASDDVLDKADALMHRHRSFVARGAHAPEVDVVPDIPVLTEKVDADGTADPQTQLRQTLELELEHWVAETLPAHVDRLTSQMREMLLTRLDKEVRTVLLERLLAALDARSERL